MDVSNAGVMTEDTADSQEQGRKHRKERSEEEILRREENMQEAVLSIYKRFGKNAIVRASDLTEGATRMQRNEQIGGHKA